ncbi:MAG: sodium-dependent transporter [Gammaproteobacteria bacterium]
MTSSAVPASPQWSSRRGFLLAALGAAVGLGNIWRFSYVAGENGGGAFVLVYLCAVLLVGWPLLIAELAIGRHARSDAVSACAAIAPRRPWCWTGWLGVAGAFAILVYYPVVAGWVAQYLWHYASGGPMLPETGTHAERFDANIADPARALSWTAIAMAATVATVAAGVQRGIERLCTVLMPLFMILLVLLAGYGLSLDGADRALAFLFAPDWSALGRPRTWLAAIGQAFFSIGLGMGVLVTYGAYAGAGVRLPQAALVIVLGDTLVSLLAGLTIFPAVFTHGLDPAGGPALAFAALPEVFAAMPAGRVIAIAFFLLLAIAALTSAVSLLEVPVALAVARMGWPRSRASTGIGALALACGIPVALGFGLLAPDPAGSPTLLDRVDHIASDLLLPASSLCVALLAGWGWRAGTARAAAGLGDSRAGTIWLSAMRAVVPLVIAIVMMRGLGWL